MFLMIEYSHCNYDADAYGSFCTPRSSAVFLKKTQICQIIYFGRGRKMSIRKV